MFPDPALRLRMGARRGLRMAADLIFPPTCAVCGTCGLDGVDQICDRCAQAVERLSRTAYCPTCARTVPPFVVSDGRCNRCRERKARIAGVARVGPYAGLLSVVMHAFKYRRRWRLGAYLGRRLGSEIGGSAWFDSVDVLVTVPRWWPRRILAGDYPPDLLTRSVTRHTGTPSIPGLRRVKGGPSQIGLSESQRIKNVRGKFAMTRGVRIRGATLCLIDDVMTTGATLDECARVLRNAGAREVYAGVAAHVSKDTPSVFPLSEESAEIR